MTYCFSMVFGGAETSALPPTSAQTSALPPTSAYASVSGGAHSTMYTALDASPKVRYTLISLNVALE